MKPKVIFIHPLKTGGTSVRYMLLHEYGSDRIAPVPMGDAFGKQDEDYLTMGGYPLQVQERITAERVVGYDVVMSHYDWGIVDKLPDWDVITILRDPVEQIRSLYEYMIARPHLFEGAIWMNRAGFTRWMQSEYAVPYLNNQTAFLSGHHVRSPYAAIDNLRNERVCFGLLEQFHETVWRWNARFGWSMTVEHRNKSRPSVSIDAETRALVENLQCQDMLLWETATAIFNERTEA